MSDTETANAALVKKAAKKTTKKKAAAAAVAEVAPDLIVETSSEIENLSKEEAYEQIPQLSDTVDFSYFRLGGVLAVVQGKESWWKDDGFDTFKEFIENKFGLQYRKAMYLIGIYGSIVESGVEWQKLSGIGWSKVKEIASIITVDNVDEWVEKAQMLTVLQLNEAVKQAKTGQLDKSDETPAESSGVTTFTVKVHPDQKATINAAIDKAKKDADTDYPGVALDAICMNFLSGAKVAKPKSLKELLKAYEAEDILKAFSELHPDVDITVSM